MFMPKIQKLLKWVLFSPGSGGKTAYSLSIAAPIPLF